MPPEASSLHPPTLASHFPSLPPEPPKSRHKLGLNNNSSRARGRMKVTKKKLIMLLVFVLSCLSILRLIKIAVITSTLSASSSSGRSKSRGQSTRQPISSANASVLTDKEMRFLSNIVSRRAPCNLLVFGFGYQYLVLSSINAGGTTLFLVENPEKFSTVQARFNNNTRIHKVEYNTHAKDAYKLLKHARKNSSCLPNSGHLEASRCKLALTKLPQKVYRTKWDVVVVDGPSGDEAEAPGRMTTIYTASMLARRGNMTDVVVHDVDRMIEKWFSWEFLCDENLVSSKGQLQNFRIAAASNSSNFCAFSVTFLMNILCA